MKAPGHVLLVLLSAGLGLAVGFALRARTSHQGVELAVRARATPAGPRVETAGALGRRDRRRGRDDSPLATQLERELARASGVTRWLHWFAALEHATPADFPRLARLANGDSPALRLLALRWAELDARHFFESLRAALNDGSRLPVNELAAVLFAEWLKRDPEAVIAALNEPGDLGLRQSWRMNVASRVVELDAERWLRLMADWRFEDFGPHMTALASWAAADPRHAAEYTLKYPAGYVSERTMEAIGNEWAKTAPASALEFASRNPGVLGSTLATTTLKEWAGRSLSAAADWLAGSDARTRNHLSPALVEQWATQDASGALAWCEANLTGSGLAQAVAGVLKGAAEKDVSAAAKLVTELNPSPARAEAAVAVARKWFPGLSSGERVPPETTAWLGSLDAESVRRVLEQVQWGWATSDPRTMAAFLAAAGTERVPVSADSIVTRELARKGPAEALEWAGRLPDGRGVEAGGSAFAKWRSTQPEAAMKWLNELPEADPRRAAYFQSVLRSLAYEPQAAEQLAAMTDPERATARRLLETMTLPEDRRARLLEALKRPR